MLTIETIKEIVTGYFQNKPVIQIYLFGSYSRGDAGIESDIDLLIYPDSSQDEGHSYFNWYEDLRLLFQKEVDLVCFTPRQHQSRWAFMERIRSERRLLYSNTDS